MKLTKRDLSDFLHGFGQGVGIVFAAALAGFFLTAPFWR